VVVLGNQAMKLYLHYQHKFPGTHPPAVVTMASFFEQQRALFDNTTGISYEVPGITTFVNLRSFVAQPIQRVGVVHRSAFTGYVERQRELARVEKVELVSVPIRNRPAPVELRRALRSLLEQDAVDALWVLNDNVLLTPELIAHAWLPVLHEEPIAVVVGVSTLVDARLHFGSFGLLPDHVALGVQTADLVYRLADADWDAEDFPVELPVSVESVVDLEWTRKHLHFREDALDRIDRIVE
jgi:ABC-type uncharacterized transport system substrate-binding protein